MVYRTGHMGDMVCSIPAFRLIRQHFIDSKLSLLCDQPAEGKVAAREVVEHLRIFDSILSYRSGNSITTGARLLRLLGKNHPDTVIYLPQVNSTEDQLRKHERFFRYAGIGEVKGFHPPRYDNEWHPNEPARLVHLLNSENIPGAKPAYDIPFREDAYRSLCQKARKAGVTLDQPFAAFCGGGKAETQKWPLDRYAVVLSKLASGTGIQIIAVGNSADAEAYRRNISPNFAGLQILNSLSIPELTELLRLATCYVGNDTGPMHMAAAVGCPVVVVMSARNKPGQWDPDIEPRLVIRQRTECEGCWIVSCTEEQHRCMTNITVEEVVSRTLPFLRGLLSNRQKAGEPALVLSAPRNQPETFSI